MPLTIVRIMLLWAKRGVFVKAIQYLILTKKSDREECLQSFCHLNRHRHNLRNNVFCMFLHHVIFVSNIYTVYCETNRNKEIITKVNLIDNSILQLLYFSIFNVTTS